MKYHSNINESLVSEKQILVGLCSPVNERETPNIDHAAKIEFMNIKPSLIESFLENKFLLDFALQKIRLEYKLYRCYINHARNGMNAKKLSNFSESVKHNAPFFLSSGANPSRETDQSRLHIHLWSESHIRNGVRIYFSAI